MQVPWAPCEAVQEDRSPEPRNMRLLARRCYGHVTDYPPRTEGHPLIKLYGADWCGDCRRSKTLLDRLGVDYSYLEVDKDDALRDEAVGIAGRQSIPVLVFPDGSFAVEPSDPDLRIKVEELGLTK
jgi:mycoredoxin